VKVEVKVVEAIDPIKLPLKGIIQLLLEKKNLNDIIALSNYLLQDKNSPLVDKNSKIVPLQKNIYFAAVIGVTIGSLLTLLFQTRRR
jgi:hypothetical protein